VSVVKDLSWQQEQFAKTVIKLIYFIDRVSISFWGLFL
jgi:hypothetical protein